MLIILITLRIFMPFLSLLMTKKWNLSLGQGFWEKEKRMPYYSIKDWWQTSNPLVLSSTLMISLHCKQNNEWSTDDNNNMLACRWFIHQPQRSYGCLGHNCLAPRTIWNSKQTPSGHSPIGTWLSWNEHQFFHPRQHLIWNDSLPQNSSQQLPPKDYGSCIYFSGWSFLQILQSHQSPPSSWISSYCISP